MKCKKTTPFKIESARLTPDGKLLLNHPALGWVITSPTGHHYCYMQEVDDAFLRDCVPVEIARPLYYIPPRKRGRGGVRWEHLLSARVWEDYSNYHPDRCNNGGCYGYWENDLLFVRLVRARNGRAVARFAAVRVCRTTADMPYTDSGEFSQSFRTWCATDVEGEFAFTESGHGELDSPLEEFPSFRWLTGREVLDTFPAQEVSRALLKKGIFLSNHIERKMPEPSTSGRRRRTRTN